MYVDLTVNNVVDYFNETCKEIDWDGESNDPEMITYEQANDISKILSTEAGIYCLRRSNGTDGMITDALCDVRERLIIEYDKKWEDDYVSYNDYL